MATVTILDGALVLPARSLTLWAVELMLAPSLARVCPAGQLATPESVSAQLKATVTAPLYQPLAFGLLVAAALIVGAVVSMLTPVWVSEALLPALSAQLPVALWLAPSALMVWLTFALSAPEMASLHAQLIVTALLFQPAALAAVRLSRAIAGPLASYLKEAVAEPALPAASVQVPLMLAVALSGPL
jgi:hypothetical protein